MVDNADLYQEPTEEFTNQNDPSRNNASSCCRCSCLSIALVSRFAIRNITPLLFGLISGIGIKWISEIINHTEFNSNVLLEISDVVSCSVTLLISYGVNYLLNKCWPANPYRGEHSNFFQTVTSDANTGTTFLESHYQSAPNSTAHNPGESINSI